jgi:hypothetical protein
MLLMMMITMFNQFSHAGSDMRPSHCNKGLFLIIVFISVPEVLFFTK